MSAELFTTTAIRMKCWCVDNAPKHCDSEIYYSLFRESNRGGELFDFNIYNAFYTEF